MIAFDAFKRLIDRQLQPVVLLEGTREVPSGDLPKLTAFARWLAELFPQARFRSGNAKGSDQAFAEGVQAVAPERLELVLPVAGHRAQYNRVGRPVRSIGLDQVSKSAEGDAATLTSQVSPQYELLMEKRDREPRLRATANYLIRDTAKVTGIAEADFARADLGIFYVNPADPMKGGTGHTIRVCRHLGIPTAFQDSWMDWQVMA